LEVEMKASFRPLVAAVLATLCLFLAASRPATAAGPGVLHTRELSIQATILGIDDAARTVTLSGPQGDVATIAVDRSVKNFPQLKIGDTIQIHYLEAVAVQIMFRIGEAL
jgi:hypothetical protein